MGVRGKNIASCCFFSLGILVFCFTFSAGTAANKREEADSQREPISCTDGFKTEPLQ